MNLSPLTFPCRRWWQLAVHQSASISKKEKRENTQNPLQTQTQLCFYLHSCTRTTAAKHPFVPASVLTFLLFSPAEGLKVITNKVHFISMRTKTAQGMHYHFTEKDSLPICLRRSVRTVSSGAATAVSWGRHFFFLQEEAGPGGAGGR